MTMIMNPQMMIRWTLFLLMLITKSVVVVHTISTGIQRSTVSPSSIQIHKRVISATTIAPICTIRRDDSRGFWRHRQQLKRFPFCGTTMDKNDDGNEGVLSPVARHTTKRQQHHLIRNKNINEEVVVGKYDYENQKRRRHQHHLNVITKLRAGGLGVYKAFSMILYILLTIFLIILPSFVMRVSVMIVCIVIFFYLPPPPPPPPPPASGGAIKRKKRKKTSKQETLQDERDYDETTSWRTKGPSIFA